MTDIEQLRIDIGRRIQEARSKTDYTQDQVGEALNISAQSVSNIEKGKYFPKINHLSEICNLLNVSCDYLMFGDAKNAERIPHIMHLYLQLPSDTQKFMDRMIYEAYKLSRVHP